MELHYTGNTKKRLDKHLHEQFPDLSRSQIQQFIRKQAVLINNKRASVHHWLKNGDIIHLQTLPQKQRLPQQTGKAPRPAVLYECNDYAVIIKPAGMLIHPTAQGESDTLAAWLLKQYPTIQDVGDDPKRPGLVHRLDKDVSGLVLVALNKQSFEYFKSLFQRHLITKKYYALVHGVVKRDESYINVPLERDRSTGRMVAQSGTMKGKEALTYVRVLKRFINNTLLDVQIITGRTHQIRTHLFSIGHSIVNDPLYQTRNIKKQHTQQQAAGLFLFAYHLAFTDHDGKSQIFTAPLPQRFQSVLDKLK